MNRNGNCEFVRGNTRIVLYPYETRIYLRIDKKGQILAGTGGHIFPGSEIKELNISGRNIKIQLAKGFTGRSQVFVKVRSEGEYIKNEIKTESVFHDEGLITVSADTE